MYLMIKMDRQMYVTSRTIVRFFPQRILAQVSFQPSSSLSRQSRNCDIVLQERITTAPAGKVRMAGGLETILLQQDQQLFRRPFRELTGRDGALFQISNIFPHNSSDLSLVDKHTNPWRSPCFLIRVTPNL